MKVTVTLLMLFLLFPLNTSAQEYTQWSLPEGAKARLGKGHITGNIAYSPDGTRLAMASSIGIWIYDAHTGKELALLTGHTKDVSGVSFSPDGGPPLPVGAWTIRYGYGRRTRENSSARSMARFGSIACRSVQMVQPLPVQVFIISTVGVRTRR